MNIFNIQYSIRMKRIIYLLSTVLIVSSCNGKLDNLQEKKSLVAKTVSVVLGLEKKAKTASQKESVENGSIIEHEEPKSLFWDSKFLFQ